MRLPVIGSINVLGVRPAFGFVVGIEPEMRLLTDTSPAADLSTFWPLARIAALTWLGVRPGRAWSMSATAPATIGAAIEVPPARM